MKQHRRNSGFRIALRLQAVLVSLCYNFTMPVIALTGNFGMGKTSVLQLVRKLGAHTFNIDTFVHDILGKPRVIKKLSEILGSDILSKDHGRVSLKKKRIADIIFNNPEKRRAVEGIIHPEVLKMMGRTESMILKKEPSAIIVFEVPLLFEAGYDNYFDNVIVVCCKRSTAIERLEKKGFSREEAVKRLHAQMPITRKKKLADHVIDNNGSIEATERKVKRILRKITIPSCL